MEACLHSNFYANVEVTRLTDKEPHPENKAKDFTADIKIYCTDCDMPFLFMGLPGGSSFSFPTCSFDQTEARMPIKPLS